MGDKYSEILINRILSLCQKRRITIYQLARMSGVSHSTIDNIRACLTSPRARLGGIFSALTALKILAIRQDCCGFLPCRTKNLSRQSAHAEILNRLL